MRAPIMDDDATPSKPTKDGPGKEAEGRTRCPPIAQRQAVHDRLLQGVEQDSKGAGPVFPQHKNFSFYHIFFHPGRTIDPTKHNELRPRAGHQAR